MPTIFDHRLALISRRALVASLMAGALAFAVPVQAEITGLDIIAPANPGGGWDQTARAMQAALQADRLASGVQVENIGGAGGTIGLAQFVSSKGKKGDAVLVGGLVMVGAILTNKSPVTLANVTPLARLTGEYELIVVPTDSPHQEHGGPHCQAEGGPGLGVLGRRLGRRHRPHPGRPDRQGGGSRSDQGQLHRPFRRRRGAVGDPGRPCHRRHQRLRGIRAADRRWQAARPRHFCGRALAGHRRAYSEGAGHRRLAGQLARRIRRGERSRQGYEGAVGRGRQDGREPGLAGYLEAARLARSCISRPRSSRRFWPRTRPRSRPR